MERGNFINLKTLGNKLKKFKYPALILLLGAVLILWPSRKVEEPPEEPPAPQVTEQQTLQEELETILSSIDGVGKVQVLLTKRTGDEQIYQTDTTSSQGADGAQSNTASTVLANGSGGEGPLVRQTVYGTYQGALIVCQGADRATVRLELVNAVAGLTGLSSDRITVIKMKS